MTAKASSDDPVVGEVRKARAALVRKGGGTLEGLFAAARAEAERARPSANRPRSTSARKRPGLTA
jgi:hypothetical protein